MLRTVPAATVAFARVAGLSLAGVRLAVTRRHRWGFPCCVFLLYLRAVAITPVGPLGAWIVHFPSDSGLPHIYGESAPTLVFSRPAQRSLTLRPANSRSRPRRPFPPEALTASLPPPPLQLLPARTTVAGRDSHPLKKHAFTAHVEIYSLTMGVYTNRLDSSCWYFPTGWSSRLLAAPLGRRGLETARWSARGLCASRRDSWRHYWTLFPGILQSEFFSVTIACKYAS